MKTFGQHYLEEEIAWLKSASEHIFFADLHIPLTSKMLKRALNTKLPRARVFHVTNQQYLDDMIKMQGTKKALSTATKLHPETIERGVNVRGGLVFELDADVLVSAPNDIMSRPDKTGRRWLEWYMLSTEGLINGLKVKNEIEQYGLKLKQDLIAKYDPGAGRVPLNKVNSHWRRLDPRNEDSPIFKNLMSKQGRKKSAAVKRTGVRRGVTRNTSKDINAVLRNMVTDYIDAMERVIAKYPKEIAALFFAHTQKIKHRSDAWDEIVVNNYKIKEILIDEWTVKTGFSRKDKDIQEEEFEKFIQKLNSLGIFHEVFDHPSEISKEITIRANLDLL